MRSLIAEGLLLFSAFATIFIMVLITIKERRKNNAADSPGPRNHRKKECLYQTKKALL